MKLASVIGFLLFALTIHAQDLPLSQEVHKMNELASANSILPAAQEQTSPETSVTNELISGGYAQPLPEKPLPIAHEGQWIATGEPMTLFRDDLVITERKEDGQLMWHVERVDSCTWCGKPMTWKQAAFDRKAISLWGFRIVMDVTDNRDHSSLSVFSGAYVPRSKSLVGTDSSAGICGVQRADGHRLVRNGLRA
jgi:hypothetical protein